MGQWPAPSLPLWWRIRNQRHLWLTQLMIFLPHLMEVFLSLPYSLTNIQSNVGVGRYIKKKKKKSSDIKFIFDWKICLCKYSKEWELADFLRKGLDNKYLRLCRSCRLCWCNYKRMYASGFLFFKNSQIWFLMRWISIDEIHLNKSPFMFTIKFKYVWRVLRLNSFTAAANALFLYGKTLML